MRALFLLAVMSAAVALATACSTPSDATCSGGCGCDGYNYCESDDDIAPPQDGGNDATLDGSCNYPDAGNDPRCPATYSISYSSGPCPQVGLTCAYPGYGDEQTGTPGCFESAVLFCEAFDSGIGAAPDAAIPADAGDASVGYWVFGQ